MRVTASLAALQYCTLQVAAGRSASVATSCESSSCSATLPRLDGSALMQVRRADAFTEAGNESKSNER